MNIVLINGSPKGEKSCSKKLLDIVKSSFDKENNVYEFTITDKRIKDLDKFDVLSNCDKIIIAFPLYVDCLPSTTIKFLEDFEKYMKDNRLKCTAKLYCIVNCGFHEGVQNRQALKIIKNFTKHIEKINYCGGIGIGTGPLIGINFNNLLEEKIKSPVMKILDNFIKAIGDGECMTKDLFIESNLNKKVYMQIANLSWISSAIKNKINIGGINNKPYKK